MAETFNAVEHDRPVCFLAYTIKGWGTPIAGHKDNHGGLMNKTQMAAWQKHMGVSAGDEWEKFATVEDLGSLQSFLDQVPFFAKGRRRYSDKIISVPSIELSSEREISTQMAFGKILDDLSKGDNKLVQPDCYDVARCDWHHQPWALGQPPQTLCLKKTGRYIHKREHPFDGKVGIYTRRSAY